MQKNQIGALSPATLLGRAMAGLRYLFRGRQVMPIRDPGALRVFINTRSSYVAQTTLYGYLRTRAGTRFPELFEDDGFVTSVNIAKWHIWLACVSDLTAYAGGMLRRNSGASDSVVGPLSCELADQILEETGTPADSGPEFGKHVERVRARLVLHDWNASIEGQASFVESPGALVFWAPIVDELKVLDAEIVRNSVRFSWNDIRRQLHHALDASAVLAEPGAVGPVEGGNAAPRA